MVRRALLAAALAGGCFGAAAGAATPPVTLGAPGRAALEPGDAIGVSWSVAADAAEFDEMELVLSLDGGRTFPLRVTRRISPSARGWSWTVPFLPTDHGRLALRAGSDERAGRERIVALSAEFAIAGRSAFPAELLFRVGEEERTADALDDPADARLPGTSLAGRLDSAARADVVLFVSRGSSSDSHPDRDRSSQAAPAVSSPWDAPRPSPRPSSSAVRLPLRL